MLNEIRTLYNAIAGFIISKEVSLIQSGAMFYKRVAFPDKKRDLINKFAKKLEIGLPENLFSLGNLSEETLNIEILYGGKKFTGEKNEKDKYNALFDLYEKISDFLEWAPFEKAFNELNCIKLSVSNTGTMYDEDIDIALRFPSDTIVLPRQLPKLDEFALETITREYSLDELFGMSATSSYSDYQSSKKDIKSSVSNYTPSLPIGLMGSGRDYEEEYYDNLDDAFQYDFFNEDKFVIVKLHIDYLKHNTTVAFPTVLFVTEKISDIDYSIKSKHNESEFHRTIKVGETNEAQVYKSRLPD